jgi:hypothetical protein
MTTVKLSPEGLEEHVGRRAVSTDVVTPGPANLLRLSFGRPEPELRHGDPQPPGWLCLRFLPQFPPEELALEEERRTVFRGKVKAGERNQAPRREEAPADVPWRRLITTDPVLLFRFSALTFDNQSHPLRSLPGHGSRGIPGVGRARTTDPTLLIDLARDHNPGVRVPRLHRPGARSPLRHRTIRPARPAERGRSWRPAVGHDPGGYRSHERAGRIHAVSARPRGRRPLRSRARGWSLLWARRWPHPSPARRSNR